MPNQVGISVRLLRSLFCPTNMAGPSAEPHSGLNGATFSSLPLSGSPSLVTLPIHSPVSEFKMAALCTTVIFDLFHLKIMRLTLRAPRRRSSRRLCASAALGAGAQISGAEMVLGSLLISGADARGDK